MKWVNVNNKDAYFKTFIFDIYFNTPLILKTFTAFLLLLRHTYTIFLWAHAQLFQMLHYQSELFSLLRQLDDYWLVL